MIRARLLILLFAAHVALPSFAGAQDWLQFRGPGGLGISRDKGLPVTWSADKNIVWKTDMPGAGTSSPIVVGNKIFLTCYTGYGLDKESPGDMSELKLHLLCLDRSSGKVLWTRDVNSVKPITPYASYIALHGYASSTPVSDGKNVYVFFDKAGVFAFDLDGKQLWQTNVGKGNHSWGSATSLLLWKDTVIVNASVESQSLFALSKNTGAEVWKAKGIKDSWSTPILVQVPKESKPELVVSGTKKIFGFDPDTGEELWHADSFNWYVCPSVIAHDGVVYALQNSTCVAVKAGGRGDVTKTHTLWQKTFGSVVPSLVFHDGHVYWADGSVNCLKADDGSVVYKERLKPNSERIYASPLLADGKLYFVSRTKGTFVVEAGPKFKLLAHNVLDPDDSVFNGSPAVSNSQLLLRSDRYLYCIGDKK